MSGAEPRLAAVVTVGTELVEGVTTDTNRLEVSRALSMAGHRVVETASVGDDVREVSATVARLMSSVDTLVVTGGLGPTHDDVTREAVADALGLPLVEDADLRRSLEPAAGRHEGDLAARNVFRQALVLKGATVIPATVGTAPGQLLQSEGTVLALLPGPPVEMMPMLESVVSRLTSRLGSPWVLSCAGIHESDAQVAAQTALGDVEGIGLTVLASPGQVQVILFDRGAGEDDVSHAARRIADELGEKCYSTSGASLAETVLALARARGVLLGTAESCTGGMVAAELTEPAGASAAFLGGVVAYSDGLKRRLLSVNASTLAEEGAVSEATAVEMARGCLRATGADLAVSVTGIAGPTGGSREKPVGLAWLGVAGVGGEDRAEERMLFGDRRAVRVRATVAALDLLRLRLSSLPGSDGA